MQQRDTQMTLLDAARIVARGTELDAKLDALCRHVLDAADARAALIYLFDPVAELLVPAAQAGLDHIQLGPAGAISATDDGQLASRVVRARRPETGPADLAAAGPAATNAAQVTGLPLVAANEMGDEEAEGVLLVTFEKSAPDLAGPEDMLLALADLCAVAIRQARLQNALLERSDWIGRLASTDALTGLANNATFERMLEIEIARATRQSTQLSVLLFDVDAFGEINAAAGAQAGDEALRHVAATLADQVRLVDTVARVGGDEFGLIAPGAGGAIAGRRIQHAIAGREAAGEAISVRVGVAIYPADGASSQELLGAARGALDQAKSRGRGSLVVASES